MLSTLAPLSLVRPTVFPSHFSLSLLLVLLVHSDIMSAIWPEKLSLPVHPVKNPLTYIFLPILPHEYSIPVDVVLVKIAVISGSFSKLEHPLSMLFSRLHRTFKSRPTGPTLNPKPVLLSPIPLPFIRSTTYMQVFSKSLNLVILPVPCQAATVCKYQTPSPVHHVILPISGKH